MISKRKKEKIKRSVLVASIIITGLSNIPVVTENQYLHNLFLIKIGSLSATAVFGVLAVVAGIMVARRDL